MNKLLQRQWKRILKNNSNPEEQIQALQEIVSKTYDESERERRRKDRSVRLMADELSALNRRIMAKSEAYIAAIMSKVADGIIIADEKHRISSMNQAAEIMFAQSSSNFINKPFEVLLDDASKDTFTRIKKAYLGEGGFQLESTELELTGINNHQKEFPIEISINPVSIEDENFFLMILKDISGRRRYEKELMEAKLKAESASEEKTRFLSNMSHEIRTPMNAVIGLTNLLLENEPREDQLEFLKTVKHSGNNLLAIINDILDFNKIEAGKVELERVPFSFKDIIRSIQVALKPMADLKGIGLELNIPGNLPDQLLGDSVRMSQILTNLISNAIKFTLEGQVTLFMEVLDQNQAEIQLYVAVEDTGIGIPEEKLEHIFESFSQSNSDTTRKFGGTGLGLTICRELVGLYGGELKVRSVLGKGSTFYFIVKLGLPDKQVVNGQNILLKSEKRRKVILADWKRSMSYW